MKSKRAVAVDAFCGAGGVSLGLREAGFNVAFAFDCDSTAVQTYERNIGPHVVQAQVEQTSGKEILSRIGLRPGELTLLSGGPPCQGFSIQRRGSRKDRRNDLIFEFVRLADEMKPHFFMMENVPAILGPRARNYVAEFEERSYNAGYRIHGAILNAANYGVPQQRRRAFLVGEREDLEGTFEFPRGTLSEEEWLTVRDAIGDLPKPLPDPNAEPEIANHRLGRISETNIKRISHVPEGGGRADIPTHLQLPCHRVSVEKAGHRGVYGRLEWRRPSGTITTKCNSFTRGRFGHPSEDRNITMREAARIQGFPDSFVFLGGTVPVAHQVGNAVPPALAAALGQAILEAYDPRGGTRRRKRLSQAELPFRGDSRGRRSNRLGH